MPICQLFDEKTRCVGLALILVISLIAAWFNYSRSVLRNPDAVRASLLKYTPLGSRFGEVRQRVEKRGWLDRRHHEVAGFYMRSPESWGA